MTPKNHICEIYFAIMLSVSVFHFIPSAGAYPSGSLTQDEGLASSQASDETLVNLAERYLTAFDVSLASQIKPFVVALNEKQKQQFLKDIEELNEAIEDEILTELFTKASGDGDETEDLSTLYGEVSKNVISRVIAQNKDKPWLSRVMNFAGNEIESSIRKMDASS